MRFSVSLIEVSEKLWMKHRHMMWCVKPWVRLRVKGRTACSGDRSSGVLLQIVRTGMLMIIVWMRLRRRSRLDLKKQCSEIVLSGSSVSRLCWTMSQLPAGLKIR